MTHSPDISASSPRQLTGGVDVDAIAAVVRSCSYVDDLDGGPFNTFATYLPGHTVPGVRVRSGRVMVQVRSRWGVPIPQVGEQVRSAVSPFILGKILDITVSDIADQPMPQPVPADPTESEVAWTSSSDGATVAPSSASIIPTEVETRTSSLPASPPSRPTV